MKLDPVAQALLDAVEVIRESRAINERLLERERSLLDFHEEVADSNDSDIRMYWDIRLVRGKDTPFTHVHGVSSMPGMLSDKLRQHASAQIEQEVSQKIAGPLVASFMEEAERQNSGTLRRIANQRLVETTTPPRLADGEGDDTKSEMLSVLSVARQNAQDNKNNASIDEREPDDT